MTQDSAPKHQQDAGEEEWELVRSITHPFRFKDKNYNVAEVRDLLNADHAAARRVRKLEEEAFLMRFQLRTAWLNIGCRCGFDDEHHKTWEDGHCPYHGTQVTKDSWEAVVGFVDDGALLSATGKEEE